MIVGYDVTSSIPISVYPAGVQGVLTVSNSSTANTVFLSDIANGQGFPVGPGSALSWDARKPLYANVLAGFPVKINVLDNGGSLFDPKAIADQLTASGLAKAIAAASGSFAFGSLPYGTGADGNVTISATNTTLTRDMAYSSLTIQAGSKLYTAGFRVQASISLINNGAISNNGTGGTLSAAGVGGTTGRFSGGGDGGYNTGAGSAPPVGDIYGGAGGVGGQSASPAAGGAVGFYAGSGGPDNTALATKRLSGGGGGGGVYTGGGGGGGGSVVIFAASLSNPGVISAIGGNGVLNTGLGSGGGGGGLVLIVTGFISGNSPVVNGGATFGVGGTAGLSGSVYQVILT